MNEQNRISISGMMSRLQERMHYKNPNQAFEVLIFGWAKSRKRNPSWLCDAKRRDWLSYRDAKSFERYCGYTITDFS